MINVFQTNLTFSLKASQHCTTQREALRQRATSFTLECIMSQNGQTHFKNLAVNAARFLKCV